MNDLPRYVITRYTGWTYRIWDQQAKVFATTEIYTRKRDAQNTADALNESEALPSYRAAGS